MSFKTPMHYRNVFTLSCVPIPAQVSRSSAMTINPSFASEAQRSSYLRISNSELPRRSELGGTLSGLTWFRTTDRRREWSSSAITSCNSMRRISLQESPTNYSSWRPHPMLRLPIRPCWECSERIARHSQTTSPNSCKMSFVEMAFKSSVH